MKRNAVRVFLIVAFWVMALSYASACHRLEGLKSYAVEKAARVAQCQLENPTSPERAKACLGQYARDLGTDSCRAARRWLEALPETK